MPYFKPSKMKKFLITITIVLYGFVAFSQIPDGYYDGTSGLTGDALKSVLNNIIDGHTELSYDAVREDRKSVV